MNNNGGWCGDMLHKGGARQAAAAAGDDDEGVGTEMQSEPEGRSKRLLSPLCVRQQREVERVASTPPLPLQSQLFWLLVSFGKTQTLHNSHTHPLPPPTPLGLKTWQAGWENFLILLDVPAP